jgi:hypothetical protein
LKISDEFLERHDASIRERLLEAADELLRRGGDPTHGTFVHAEFRAINQSLHTATSVLLLGAPAEELKRTLEWLPSLGAFAGRDPASIVTIAVLHFLMHRVLASSAHVDPPSEKVRLLHTRFDELNWMTSSSVTEALGIRPLKYEQA